MIRGVQLTNVQGPYWFDGRQLVFGAVADRDTQHGAPATGDRSRARGSAVARRNAAALGAAPSTCRPRWPTPIWPRLPASSCRTSNLPSARYSASFKSPGTRKARHTWRGDGKDQPPRSRPLRAAGHDPAAQAAQHSAPRPHRVHEQQHRLSHRRRRPGLRPDRLQRRRHQPQGQRTDERPAARST